MNLNDVFQSKYLKESDLKGRTVRVVIEDYAMEQMGKGDDKKLVLYFAGIKKGMVTNKTNASRIALKHGQNIDKWKGAQIELYPDVVDFQGEATPCIRVRASAPAPAAVSDGLPGDDDAPAPSDDDVPF